MTGPDALALVGMTAGAVCVVVVIVALVRELAETARDIRSVEAFAEDFIPHAADVAAAEAALPAVDPAAFDGREVA